MELGTLFGDFVVMLIKTRGFAYFVETLVVVVLVQLLKKLLPKLKIDLTGGFDPCVAAPFVFALPVVAVKMLLVDKTGWSGLLTDALLVDAVSVGATSVTVYKLFDSAIVTVPGQKKKITVEEALQSNQFQKIYLMIGINEMGTGTVESFAKKYEEVVNHLRELQPEAIIYIQGIMKVTTARSEQGDYITNEGIEARNEAISLLEDKERIFYLDVNPELCDETGGLKEEYTFDGVHLKAQYIEIWKDFLKTHAIL